jgi:hypothetical protein
VNLQGARSILTPFEKTAYCLPISSSVSNILHGLPFRIVLKLKTAVFQASLGTKMEERSQRPSPAAFARRGHEKRLKATKKRLKQSYDAQPAVHAACPSPCSCPCPCCMSVSMLHVHVRAAGPRPCCMSMSMLHVHVHAACPFPCCISMTMSILNVHVHGV